LNGTHDPQEKNNFDTVAPY